MTKADLHRERSRDEANEHDEHMPNVVFVAADAGPPQAHVALDAQTAALFSKKLSRGGGI